MSEEKDTVVNQREFSILRIFAESNGFWRNKSKLKLLVYLIDKESEHNLFTYKKGNVGPEPKQLDRALESLESKNMINIIINRTFGGNKRYKFEITHEYRYIIDAEIKNEEYKNILTTVREKYDEYADIPISNLQVNTKEKYPKYFIGNTHLY